MVQWEEPPAVNFHKAPLPEWADDLMENPGKWAKVEVFGNKSQANAEQYRISHRFPGHWEATYRFTDDVYSVYARFIRQ